MVGQEGGHLQRWESANGGGCVGTYILHQKKGKQEHTPKKTGLTATHKQISDGKRVRGKEGKCSGCRALLVDHQIIRQGERSAAGKAFQKRARRTFSSKKRVEKGEAALYGSQATASEAEWLLR